jgi:Fe-S cluster biogenesis protein NfuA
MSTEATANLEVEAAIADLNLALRTHGGAVAYVAIEGDTLRLRMDGLCAACLFKPVTLAATIRPYIHERLGMRVELHGARISDEAQTRLQRALAACYEPAVD